MERGGEDVRGFFYADDNTTVIRSDLEEELRDRAFEHLRHVQEVLSARGLTLSRSKTVNLTLSPFLLHRGFVRRVPALTFLKTKTHLGNQYPMEAKTHTDSLEFDPNAESGVGTAPAEYPVPISDTIRILGSTLTSG